MFRKTVILMFSVLLSSLAVAGNSDLELCINGGVSATGNFPSQAMEDQIHAYLDWRSDQGSPYYLFRVASQRMKSAYEID